ALLLQALMRAGTPTQDLWVYFIPVLAPMVVYSWLALRWAIEQFQREEVLFREAERLEVRLWLRHLLREKDPLPSTGQALFCFGVILSLLLFVRGFQAPNALEGLMMAAVGAVTFVGAPPVFMALGLTTRPRDGLKLHATSSSYYLYAVGLAVLLFVPCTETT